MAMEEGSLDGKGVVATVMSNLGFERLPRRSLGWKMEEKEAGGGKRQGIENRRG